MRQVLSLALVIYLSTSLSGVVQAQETIGDAYAREFTFLKAQKTELENRLANEAGSRINSERRAEAELVELQRRFLEISTEVNQKQQELAQMQLDLSDVQDNTEVIDGVLLQMESTLSPYGLATTSGGSTEVQDKLTQGFLSASALINQLSSQRIENSEFYLSDGARVEGQIVHLGNVAAMGISEEGSGALVPAGGGKLRLWEQPGSDAAARRLLEGSELDTVPLFIFENRDAEISPPEQKTLQTIVQSGGIIGYVILGLGALGSICAVLRFLYLLMAGSSGNGLARKISRQLSSGDYARAQKTLMWRGSCISRVMREIVGNISTERERLDDIISESVIRESSKLDRLGSLILVIAAVAPLLGLLGTVTGMISTFDAITEYGTGDPKLLAGGISVALVTTMLGLMVAIPLLLVGNLLTGWAQRTKDALEKNALHVVNQYEKSRAVARAS